MNPSKPHSLAAMPSIPAYGLLGLIQLYKWTLSPLIGKSCRYEPTCSTYAFECVQAHGAWAGSWMSAARLCRCHPGAWSGYDPAPVVKPRVPFWAPWRFGDWRWRSEPAGEDGQREDTSS